jgi:predicted nucleic acid-binding protein
MISYFDSSVLLAILLDEENKQEAFNFWKESQLRVSSILLKIETITVLRRTYEHYKSKLSKEWLTIKTKELEEYLCEINFRIIDEEIEKSIFLRKDMAKCRTLDAIHIATALEFMKIDSSKDFHLYSYDDQMLALAKMYKIKTN